MLGACLPDSRVPTGERSEGLPRVRAPADLHRPLSPAPSDLFTVSPPSLIVPLPLFFFLFLSPPASLWRYSVLLLFIVSVRYPRSF